MKKNSLDILKKQGSGFKTPKGYFETVEGDVFSKFATKSFPTKSGYSAPKNYFDTIEIDVFTKIDASELYKQQQFDVPKDYFKTLEDNVFKKIQEQDAKQPSIISLKTRVTKIFIPIAIAASFLLLFTIYTPKADNNYSFDNLAATDIENWIEDDYISLDSYQIAEVYNDVNFEDEFDEEDIELLDYINGTDIESVLLTDYQE